MFDVNRSDSIHSDLLDKLLFKTRTTVFAASMLSIMLALLQFESFNKNLVLIWLTLVLVVNFCRIVVSHYYLAHPTKSLPQVLFRLKIFRAGVITSSITWGSNALILINSNGVDNRSLIASMVVGLILSSGAVISYSIDKVSSLAFIVFALIPFQIALLFTNTPVGYEMFAISLIYIICTLYGVNKSSQQLHAAIKYQHESTLREEQVRQLAFYDALTNLPNRRLLEERIEQALLKTKRHHSGLALFFLDLDNFKMLNDTYGHDVGDNLLKQVAERLKQSLRESDTLARLGGDEFVIMVENLSSELDTSRQEISVIMENISKSLKAPFLLKDLKFQTSLSIGVALMDEYLNDYSSLVHSADTAMYQAKRAGKNRWAIYGEEETKSLS